MRLCRLANGRLQPRAALTNAHARGLDPVVEPVVVVPVDMRPDPVAVPVPLLSDMPLDPPELQLLPCLPPTAPGAAVAPVATFSRVSLPWEHPHEALG